MFVLPFAAFDAPEWLHQALETRAFATIAGRRFCWASYVRAQVHPGEVHTPAMEHEYDCPARHEARHRRGLALVGRVARDHG
jgi:hypothetical protein